jgi:predicted 2-oxoglutarate/Fe(II)-dependent dioxygenase YbiX
MFIQDTEILYIENFLSDDEMAYIDGIIAEHQEKIDNLIANNKDSDHTSSNEQTRDLRLYRKDEDPFNEVFENINARTKNLIIENFNVRDIALNPIYNVHVLYPPFLLEDHYDGQNKATGQNGNIVSISHGAVIYLSDPNDYTGGDLVYKKLGLRLRPSKGSIILHPGSEKYFHGVDAVTSGVRLNISMFAHEIN